MQLEKWMIVSIFYKKIPGQNLSFPTVSDGKSLKQRDILESLTSKPELHSSSKFSILTQRYGRFLLEGADHW
jgi:hypothetical protein